MISRRRDSGFSLIELAIIMAVISALAVAALDTYRVWLNAKISGDTFSRRNLVTDALVLFSATYGRMPCPADPALKPDAPTAGYEVCLPAAAVGSCSAPAPPYGGGAMCKRAGRRDTAADANTTVDNIYIGAVPYAALGLTVKDAVDGWNNKMTYAVSEYMTQTATFNDQRGVIRILQGTRQSDGTLFGPNNTLNPDVKTAGANTADSYLFALVSHGKDGKGAYNYDGQQPIPCAATPGLDNENCDGDADFTNASATTGIYNSVPGAAFFDDAFTAFRIRREGDKWSYSSTSSMMNKAGQRVGVGAPIPTYTLDVGGAIKLEDYQANEYCSLPDTATAKPSYCFEPDMIGGAGIHCVTGSAGSVGVLMGLDSTSPVCGNIVSTATLSITAPCPDGQFMQGLDATGGKVCVVPAPP